jgi:hypothetical protein
MEFSSLRFRTKMWSELGPDLRAIYQKWDTGAINTDRTIAAIAQLGVTVPVEFVNTLTQYSRSRNLPYNTFVKALQHGVFNPEPENKSVLPNSPRAVKDLADFNLKTYKSAPPEKAPYGNSLTSLADDAHLETASLCSSVRCGTLKHSQRKALPHTAQLESAQEDSLDDCGGSNAGSLEVPYLPPHLQRNFNVFQSDENPEPLPVFEQSKICAGHGDIIGWTETGNETDSQNTSRKHFSANTSETADLFNWTAAAPTTQAATLPRSNLLAHPENEKRPGTATLIKYPFATEVDDLRTARERLRRQRLDKQKA